MRPDLPRKSIMLNDTAIQVVDAYADAALNWVNQMISSYEKNGDKDARQKVQELIQTAINHNRDDFRTFIEEAFKNFLEGGIDKESRLYHTLDLRYRFLNTLSKNCNGEFDTPEQQEMLRQVKRLITYNGSEEELKKQITDKYKNKILQSFEKEPTPKTLVISPGAYQLLGRPKTTECQI